jgi:hypothetical protein
MSGLREACDTRRHKAVVRVLAAAVLYAAGAPTHAQEVLPILAHVGPWPAVSNLIGYDGRLWLVNSVKGANHNSAEIYSYTPRHGALRYERHLFSQDAGRPAVFGGLLYWPYEDSRFSLGWGRFAVTDGARWHSGLIPSARAFHTHALAGHDGRLIAATSAWRAGLQVSGDGGVNWRRAYDHPTPDRRVSRITTLAGLGGSLVGTLRDSAGRRLVRFDGKTVEELPGWPKGQVVEGHAVRDGRLYGLVAEADGAGLWRSDGAASERVSDPRDDWQPRGLAVGPCGLWTVSVESTGGLLWHRPDGGRWRARYRLEGGTPREVMLYGGQPYVGGAGSDGRGILWGPPPPASVEVAARKPASLDGFPGRAPTAVDWAEAGAELDGALSDPASYDSHGRVLRNLVYRAALAGPPPGFFSGRLSSGVPDRRLTLIGGKVSSNAGQLARWILLWGMAVAGEGHVPLALISKPWAAPPNPSEKYFESSLAAIWAAGEIGQDDRATIDVLIDRLERPDDPPWLLGDLVGALTALTGERFGFDAAAWRAWWQATRSTWPR